MVRMLILEWLKLGFESRCRCTAPFVYLRSRSDLLTNEKAGYGSGKYHYLTGRAWTRYRLGHPLNIAPDAVSESVECGLPVRKVWCLKPE